MKCYNINCNNEVPESSEYTAFCCKQCWKEYNNIKDNEDKPSTRLSIKELQRKCFIRAKELREEKYQDFMKPIQGL